jgi:hypothetical protein
MKHIKSYFTNHTTESAIFNAGQEGYKLSQIAKFLNLSTTRISEILTIYNQKVALFDNMRKRGIFWSYDKDIEYEDFSDELFIEYLLKYGDFEDIVLCLKLFGKQYTKRVWQERLSSDKRFVRLNLMLARVFFDMDVEADYFKEMESERLKKLKKILKES